MKKGGGGVAVLLPFSAQPEALDVLMEAIKKSGHEGTRRLLRA